MEAAVALSTDQTDLLVVAPTQWALLAVGALPVGHLPNPPAHLRRAAQTLGVGAGATDRTGDQLREGRGGLAPAADFSGGCGGGRGDFC